MGVYYFIFCVFQGIFNFLKLKLYRDFERQKLSQLVKMIIWRVFVEIYRYERYVLYMYIEVLIEFFFIGFMRFLGIKDDM